MSAASFPTINVRGNVTCLPLYKESVILQDSCSYCMCDINFHLGSERRNMVSHPEYQAVFIHSSCDYPQTIALDPKL